MEKSVGIGRDQTMKVSAETLEEVELALDVYINEVEASLLRRATKHTYVMHAHNFVRWLKDDFEPGATLRPKERQ